MCYITHRKDCIVLCLLAKDNDEAINASPDKLNYYAPEIFSDISGSPELGLGTSKGSLL